MRHLLGDYAAGALLPEQDELVEALGLHRSDTASRECVHVRSLEHRPNHVDAGPLEDRVEPLGDLRIPVDDQELLASKKPSTESVRSRATRLMNAESGFGATPSMCTARPA